jgi:hypothetical protein
MEANENLKDVEFIDLFLINRVNVVLFDSFHYLIVWLELENNNCWLIC